MAIVPHSAVVSISTTYVKVSSSNLNPETSYPCWVCTVFLCPPAWMLEYKFGLVYDDQWIMDGKGCWKCPWPHFKYICFEILNLLWSWGLNSNYWQEEKVLNLKYQYSTTHLLARYIVKWLRVTKRLGKLSLLADICAWDLPNANQHCSPINHDVHPVMIITNVRCISVHRAFFITFTGPLSCCMLQLSKFLQ